MHTSTFTNAASSVNNTEVVHRINSNQSSPLKGTLKAKAWSASPFSQDVCRYLWQVLLHPSAPGLVGCLFPALLIWGNISSEEVKIDGHLPPK